jgi:hypothetical protein
LSLTLRAQRLRLPWLLAIPFLFSAQPTPKTLLLGFLITLPGLCLRLVASGHIHKDQTLAVGGPFALLRHPLYLGSLFIGLGLAFGGGIPGLVPVFLLLFGWLYYRTARREEGELEARFGQEFLDYKRRVPALLPRVWKGREPREGMPLSEASPGAPPTADGVGFRVHLFVINKGWEAPLGTVGGFTLLWGKMVLFGG